MTPTVADREYETLARFRHELRGFLRFSEEAARSAGLHPAQHQLLLAIRGHPGPSLPSVSDMAERLLLQLHSASELVDRAERNGLVRRAVDPDDHRRALLSLTAAGAAKLEALSVLHRQELHRFRTHLLPVLDDLS